jgi:hypothetical protein
MQSHRVSDIQKYVMRVPNLNIATEIEKSPIDLKAKLRKANKSTSSNRKAIQCNQGISFDFGFVRYADRAGFDRAPTFARLETERRW